MDGIALLKRTARRLLRGSSDPTVGGEKESSYYDKLYSDQQAYHVRYTESPYYFLWAVIADRVENSGVRSVLEIGCGPGQLAAMLMDRGLPRHCGLDFSPQAVEMARANCPRGRFEVGDARTTDLHSQVDHDLVICTEVLEHIDDDLLVVSRFTPGVRCVCTVPNFAHESHVRFFKDADEVAARYGAFFTDLKVSTWTSSRYDKDLFFLMDGRRSTRVAAPAEGVSGADR